MNVTTSWNCGLKFMSFDFLHNELNVQNQTSFMLHKQRKGCGANSVSVRGICIQKLATLVYRWMNESWHMINQSTNLLSTLILLLFMSNLGPSIKLFHE